jgi:hypothetical protein
MLPSPSSSPGTGRGRRARASRVRADEAGAARPHPLGRLRRPRLPGAGEGKHSRSRGTQRLAARRVMALLFPPGPGGRREPARRVRAGEDRRPPSPARTLEASSPPSPALGRERERTAGLAGPRAQEEPGDGPYSLSRDRERSARASAPGEGRRRDEASHPDIELSTAPTKPTRHPCLRSAFLPPPPRRGGLGWGWG